MNAVQPVHKLLVLRQRYQSSVCSVKTQIFIFLRSKPKERRKKFNCFFWICIHGWLNSSSKTEKNKGDRDFKLPTESFTSSFGRRRQKIAPKSVQHVQHDYFPSFNQSNHWFVALSFSLAAVLLAANIITLLILAISMRYWSSCFTSCLYLTVILRGRAGYELIYITNEAVGRVGYYQLISGKSEKNNCFSKFSSNSLDVFGWNLLKSWHFLYRRRCEKNFSDLQNFRTRNSSSVFPYLVKRNDNGSYDGLREPIRKLENHYPELKIY